MARSSSYRDESRARSVLTWDPLVIMMKLVFSLPLHELSLVIVVNLASSLLDTRSIFTFCRCLFYYNFIQ